MYFLTIGVVKKWSGLLCEASFMSVEASEQRLSNQVAGTTHVVVPLVSLKHWQFHENLLLDTRRPTGILSILLFFKPTYLDILNASLVFQAVEQFLMSSSF